MALALLITAVAGLVMLDQRCWGTMSWLAMATKFADCGVEKFITTVLASGVVTLVVAGTPPELMAGVFCSRSKVNLTSAEEKAWPSLHFTPGVSARVSVLLPLDQV